MSVFSKIFKLIARFFKLRNTTHPVTAITQLKENKKAQSTDINTTELKTGEAAAKPVYELRVFEQFKRDESTRRKHYSPHPSLLDEEFQLTNANAPAQLKLNVADAIPAECVQSIVHDDVEQIETSTPLQPTGNLQTERTQKADADDSKQVENQPLSLPTNEHQVVSDMQRDATTRKAPYSAGRVFMQHVYGSAGYDKLALKNWLLQKFIPAAAVGILVGASQAFKTFIALYIALCIANQRLLGRYRTKQGLVFIAVGEGVNGITMRIKALEDLYGSIGSKIIIFPETYNLEIPEEAAHMAKVMREESTRQGLPAAMLILDTLSQNAAGIRENDAAAMSSYLRACADFARDNDITVLNVHHEGKSGNMRGSSTLLCNVDFVLNAKRVSGDKYETILSIDKMKDGSSDPAMLFKLEQVDMGLKDCFEEDISTLVVTEASETETVSSAPTLSPETTWLKAKVDDLSNDAELRVNNLQADFMAHFKVNKPAANTRLTRAVDTLEQSGLIKTSKKGKFRYITRR